MKNKALMIAGLVLWGTLFTASRVDAAEDAEEFLQEKGVEIPEEIAFWSEHYGEKYGICPEVIEAMIWTESRCIPSAQSADKSCKGLMQIKPSCHQERMEKLKARNVFGIPENIRIGTDYLAELAAGEPDIAVALARYNGQNEEKIRKTREGQYSGYVKQILQIAEALEEAHGK